MSKILSLDEHDLYLTYSWSTTNHGICGHTYEVIEYFWILRNHFDVGILLAEDITSNMFKMAIKDKYNYSESEIELIMSCTIFNNRPRLVKGKNILFTDGGVVNNKKNILLFDNIFYFACGNKEVKDNNEDNTYILQDDRVYEPVKKNGINYKKKILFNRLKQINETPDNKIMLYGTENCRLIPGDDLKKLLNEYPKDEFLYLSNNPLDLQQRVQQMTLPVKDLFSKFSTYVYTPVPRHFDCSPRLIAECKWYNRKVIYWNIDYLSEDRGLYWRRFDIEEDFDSINLKEDDQIINILGGICG